MQTAQNAVSRNGDVILYKIPWKTRALVPLNTVRFEEVAARVCIYSRLKYLNA